MNFNLFHFDSPSTYHQSFPAQTDRKELNNHGASPSNRLTFTVDQEWVIRQIEDVPRKIANNIIYNRVGLFLWIDGLVEL